MLLKAPGTDPGALLVLYVDILSVCVVEVGQFYFDGHFVPDYGKEDIGSGYFT